MPATVIKTDLPAQSRLHGYMRPGDFLDCYRVQSTLPAPDAAQIIVAFPQWAKALVALRGVLVAPFGLRNDAPGESNKLGPFPVEHTSDTEVIAGFNDKHLDFRVSVYRADGQVSLATWVHPHNIGGRAYLTAILPFHILIARNALARVAGADHLAGAA
ncbi:DUF2867 domain-containing protein [Roseobacter sinensis]|uniref:DUF2867 domain-containing protein n=1 Tax=Roseobacter sinensis TaxID=2931391 RepID=A0ABT3BGF1_9RHOB|nr:DUF2867 domain-containing protein [Roseobacter sp. WL0113]MCV3272661.1 DUF2867 domain-containing protein [Roseobacter sp. WL0113]